MTTTARRTRPKIKRMTPLPRRQSWKALQAHYKNVLGLHLRALYRILAPARFEPNRVGLRQRVPVPILYNEAELGLIDGPW